MHFTRKTSRAIGHASIVAGLWCASTSWSAAQIDVATVVDFGAESVQPGGIGKVAGVLPATLDAAQSLTVGLTGHLTRIDLWLGKQADTRGAFEIVLKAGGDPDNSDAIFTKSVDADVINSSSLWDFHQLSIDVGEMGLIVAAGQMLTVVITAPDIPVSNIASYWTPLSWAHESNALYDHGSRYLRGFDGAAWLYSPADNAVRTWISPVPEASALTYLVAGAVVSLGVFTQRQRAKHKNLFIN